jgi:hypothetical protein
VVDGHCIGGSLVFFWKREGCPGPFVIFFYEYSLTGCDPYREILIYSDAAGIVLLCGGADRIGFMVFLPEGGVGGGCGCGWEDTASARAEGR